MVESPEVVLAVFASSEDVLATNREMLDSIETLNSLNSCRVEHSILIN